MLKNLLKKAAFIPAIVMMVIIWGFSNSTADDSSSLSLEVTQTAVSLFKDCGIGQEWSETYQAKIIEKIHTPVRKMAHMTEYALLSVCFASALYINGFRGKKLKIINQIICTTYAVSDEIHQLFVKDRACRILDVIIDATGVFIGAVIIIALIVKIDSLISKKKEKKSDFIAKHNM